MKTNAPDLSRNLAPELTPVRLHPDPLPPEPARRHLWTALALLFFTCWLPWATQAQEYPVMELTPEESAEIETDHLAMPGLPVFATAAPFPSSFSLLRYLPYVPVERSQGGCGNCWAWASTGVMEIAHAVENGVRNRLSVQFLNSCNQNKPCCGSGSMSHFVKFYTNHTFAVPWSNTGAAWARSGSCAIAPCDSIDISARYNISSISARGIRTHGNNQSEAIGNIKSALTQYKGVYFLFALPSFSPFQAFWRSQPESAVWNSFIDCNQTWTNVQAHAVLCVGYDETDPNNRYWIMVNSWGVGPTTNRPNGVFRVAMDINYSCQYVNSSGSTRGSLHWQTLDMAFDEPIRRPEIQVSLGSRALVDGQNAVDFGSAPVGEAGSARTFTVRNSGSATLMLGRISVPSGYVVSEGLPASLEPGQQNSFTVALRTTSVGTKSGQISIVNDDRNENPFNFSVTGQVYQPPTLVWVDGDSRCANPTGQLNCPYQSVSAGWYAVARYGTVRIRTGTYEFCGTKSATFEAYGGPVLLTPCRIIQIGEPGGPPKLGTPAPTPAGGLVMRFTGTVGQRYQVLTSTDLVTWELWKEFTPETDAFDILDDDAALTPHRFFKVVSP